MSSKKSVLILSVLRLCYCDWVSDWMTPVQDEFGSVKDINNRKNDDSQLKMYEDEELRIPAQFLSSTLAKVSNDGVIPEISNIPPNSLKIKLQTTLEKAKTLADALKEQILAVTNREALLKEAIASGRLGVSSVTVYTLDHAPRSYLIRDGFWTVCNGAVKPAADNPYSKLQSSPRCLGVETPSKPDPCVFNSVIKYETIPTRRRVEYSEEDYLCLKSGFNNTIEQYLSVPKRVVNETCKNGIVRSLEENVAECGLRVLSEYLYYPSSAATVPREYCVGACRLLAAWHLSNTTIENFEFLKDEPGFKKYFVKSDSERLI